MYPLYTPWRHLKTFAFINYKMGKLTKTGLKRLKANISSYDDDDDAEINYLFNGFH